MRMLNSDSRSRSAVGRMSRDDGDARLRPFNRPPTTRILYAPRRCSEDIATRPVRPLSPQLGFTRGGSPKMSKSDISDSDRERGGVRGCGLSMGPNPSPELLRTALARCRGNSTSPDGRGVTDLVAGSDRKLTE